MYAGNQCLVKNCSKVVRTASLQLGRLLLERQTDKQADGTDRQTDGQMEEWTGTQAGWQAGRTTDSQINRVADRQTTRTWRKVRFHCLWRQLV